MTTRFTILLAGLFGALQAFAHRPYEVAAGSFTRNDGVTVLAFEHYVDGILGADPVSVQFRLPDGSVIAQTERSPDSVVVRRTAGGLEVYRFKSDWIPFADNVQRFDGYLLTDIRTQRSRCLSPLVHTRAHVRDYAIVLGLAGLLVVCGFAARAIPRRGWLATLRVGGFIAVGLAAGLFVLLVLVAVPVSPFILCILGGVGVAFCLPLSRLIRHAPAG